MIYCSSVLFCFVQLCLVVFQLLSYLLHAAAAAAAVLECSVWPGAEGNGSANSYVICAWNYANYSWIEPSNERVMMWLLFIWLPIQLERISYFTHRIFHV